MEFIVGVTVAILLCLIIAIVVLESHTLSAMQKSSRGRRGVIRSITADQAQAKVQDA